MKANKKTILKALRAAREATYPMVYNNSMDINEWERKQREIIKKLEELLRG